MMTMADAQTPPPVISIGKVLKDDDLLTTYKLATSHTVHLVKGAPKASSATGGASSSNTGAAAFGAPPPQRLPTLAAGQGSGPMAALEGVQVRCSFSLCSIERGTDFLRPGPRDRRRHDEPLRGHGQPQ